MAEALINERIITWARERVGFDIPILANVFGLPSEHIQK